MNSFMNGFVAARARRVWFLARWLVVGAALPLVWACNPRTVIAPTYDPNQNVSNDFPSSLAPKLDVLFMVDNSPSMKPLQQELVKEFPTFMEPLKKVPTADGLGMALPDIHVAVVSSDTGSAGARPTTFCSGQGDGGKFQFLPRGACTGLHTTPTQQTFLAASMNQTVTNFDGDISDAFACIAQLGDQGCGFEGQLKSVRWALDRSNLPDGNQGFLRDDAFLAVVLITNEDDCSVPDDSDLIDPDQTLMSDPLGPYWSFRCNEFGHLCNINGILQPPPRGAADDLQGCISNETSTSKLTHVADEVAFLKGLKKDPSQIVVAAITGLPTSYGVEMIPGSTDRDPPHPNIKHACVSKTDSTINADPAVRLQQWVESFGDHGIIENICADTLNPALERIAKLVALQLGPQCVTGQLQDKDPSTLQLDPECQVMDSYVDAEKHEHQTALAACAVDPTPPCWSLVDDTGKCAAAKRLQVTRDGATLPDGMHTTISCSLCIPGVVAPGCP